MAGPGHPHRKKKTLASACNIKEWKQGIKENDPKVELRNERAGNCGADPRNAQSQNVRRGEDIIEDKADHNFLETLLVDLPPPEGEVLIEEAIKDPIS